MLSQITPRRMHAYFDSHGLASPPNLLPAHARCVQSERMDKSGQVGSAKTLVFQGHLDNQAPLLLLFSFVLFTVLPLQASRHISSTCIQSRKPAHPMPRAAAGAARQQPQKPCRSAECCPPFAREPLVAVDVVAQICRVPCLRDRHTHPWRAAMARQTLRLRRPRRSCPRLRPGVVRTGIPEAGHRLRRRRC